MPVHPAMTANLWPRNTPSCDHKFTIDGPSRAESVSRAGFGAESSPGNRLDGTGAAQRRVVTRQRPESGENRALDAPTGPRRPNAAPPPGAPPASTRPVDRGPDPPPPSAPLFPVSPPDTRQTNKAAQQTRAAPPPRTATGEHPTRRPRAGPSAALGAAVPRQSARHPADQQGRPADPSRSSATHRHRRAPDPSTAGRTLRRPRRRCSPSVRPTPGRPTRPPSRPEPLLRHAPPPASTRPVDRGPDPPPRRRFSVQAPRRPADQQGRPADPSRSSATHRHRRAPDPSTAGRTLRRVAAFPCRRPAARETTRPPSRPEPSPRPTCVDCTSTPARSSARRRERAPQQGIPERRDGASPR
ncbi:hypothetical protein EKD16_20790 [Streptomonospora litoralis]|uniref:Uncharacterized protein n=1 Tax=Streptomonospora litoralis TaxID=2498135 RepID=A0A4P6Q9V4_9ACTN|nr:hypothetical protein EKD16_20790 [Streptomonospora litoralis]